MCKRVIRACSYKEHSRDICRGMFCIRQYLSKKEKKRKELKMGFVFLFKSHTCTCVRKKWNTHLQFFGFMRFSGWTCKSNRYFSNFFTLVQQRISKAYAINCSCFATGAQKALYNQQKKERTKRNNPWPHFLVVPNSPEQFCPFPVYPGWQSHTYDPLVLVQFASSWQEWFPLHSSMSMKSQMKKWDFRIMQYFFFNNWKWNFGMSEVVTEEPN